MSNKTQPKQASVSDFLSKIENDNQKQDCLQLNLFF